MISHLAFAGGESNLNAVFLNYSQEELDHNYKQEDWAPNLEQILQRYDFRSQVTRERLGDPEQFSVSKDDSNKITFYRAKNANAPVHIFIHGGGWRAGVASSYLFPAEMFLDRGISYAALDFNHVQEVGLDGMVDEVKRAIEWIYRNSERLGIDRERIFISGHSSGAHLAGVILTSEWESQGLPENLIKGATLISGMYDLEAVRLSARSKYVPFTDEIEDSMSPQRHLGKIDCDVILAYGGLETREFQRQTIDFFKAMKSSEKSVQLVYLEPYNHVEIMDDFANPYNPVAKQTLEMIANTVR